MLAIFKMKYEQYAQLTPQQKEEWNFKYKDISYPAVSYSSINTTAGFLTVILCVYLMILKEYVEVSIDARSLLAYAFPVMFIMALAWVIDYIGQLLYYIYQKYKEKKFIKECIK